MDVLNKEIFKSNWHFFLGLILTLGISWLLFSSSFFNEQSISVIRLKEMNECFKDRQIPCRWVPDLQNLYGYPLFNFHAPLPYYFGELFYLLTNNFILTAKLVFAIPILVSYVFMYLNFKRLNKFISTIIVSLFIVVLTSLIYKREAIGEIWAFMFLSNLLYLIPRLKEQINLKKLLLFAIIISFLITVYNLSFIILLPVILFFFGIIFIKKRQMKFLWFSLAGVFLGILLSSFYLLPMIFERNFIQNNYIPISAKEIPPPATSKLEKLIGDNKIIDYKEGSNWLSFNTETNNHTIIRLNKYYFPNWKIFVDKKEILVEYKDNSMGLMTLILGKGNHTIYAKLEDTPIRSLSNLITLFGFGVTLILFLVSFPRIRKWLLYYKKGVS